MGVTIGNIKLPDKPLFLAPMEDVTDPSFRYMCKSFGADMTYTEFIASEALVRDIEKTKKKLTIFDYERPIGIQLYGHIVESMVDSAKMMSQYNPDLIDINFGCPVKKIANRGAGAGMLKDIPKMIQMTREIVEATSLPVTVKTRLGWDDESKNIVDIAERLQDTGIKALTIHGRTRAQFYSGIADWTLIGQVKNNPRMHIPIIGNGDICSGQMAMDYFNRYGVDGIMIGRATYGRPWIFKEIKYYIENQVEMPPLSIQEKVNIAKTHFLQSLQHKGKPRGIYEMRRHFSTYFKALPHFKEIRMQLVTSLDTDEIMALLDLIADKYREY